jgi:hypothetical protein
MSTSTSVPDGAPAFANPASHRTGRSTALSGRAAQIWIVSHPCLVPAFLSRTRTMASAPALLAGGGITT